MSKRNYWVLSDPHLHHTNILHYARPEFDSVQQMNECIYDHWNETVKPGDKVYVLGDLYMKVKAEVVGAELKKLPGRKQLIVGNHDDILEISRLGIFYEIRMWKQWKEQGVLLTHVPVHEFSRKEKLDLLNIHGHTHLNGSPEGRYISACVEYTDYRPVTIEELKERYERDGHSKSKADSSGSTAVIEESRAS